MPPFKLIALLVAVTVVAGCGQDSAPPLGGGGAERGAEAAVDAVAPADRAGARLDDDEVVRLVFEAAADDDLSRLPVAVDGRVSAMRVGVVALHDQLLERHAEAPELPKLLDVLEAVSRLAGCVDGEALAAAVPVWRTWTDADRDAEEELARLLSIANASFSLPDLPGADGLADIADRAAGFTAPAASPAAAGIAFVRYASLAIGEEGADTTAAQTTALEAARSAFDTLHWPGGLALMAEPVAVLLLRDDPASMRGTVLFSTAADGYRASGDLLRSGDMYVSRARMVWRGQPDFDAARRAALLAETGRRRIEESGVVGRDLFDACFVQAYALQAAGKHEESLAAAAAAEKAAPEDVGDELADLDRSRAVSLFRMGRFDDALAAAEAGLERLGPEYAPEQREAVQIVPVLHELAAQSLLRLARPDEAIVHLEAVIAFHEREAGEPWASDETRDAARLTRARALALRGDAASARDAVREVLDSAAQGTQMLALAADVMLEAGYVDDADTIVTQAEQAIGPSRSAIFGELRGRIEAARGNLDAARASFQGAVHFVTGGDTTRQSLSASRILESWARVEEAAGNRERAAELFHSAANHLIDVGVDRELQRLLAEVKRLRD